MLDRDEAFYRAKLVESGVPDYMHDSYIRYLLHGIEPGSFLLAVLINDLREAVARADRANQAALANHVRFLYNHAPGNCWGSPERVREWLVGEEAVSCQA